MDARKRTGERGLEKERRRIGIEGKRRKKEKRKEGGKKSRE